LPHPRLDKALGKNNNFLWSGSRFGTPHRHMCATVLSKTVNELMGEVTNKNRSNIFTLIFENITRKFRLLMKYLMRQIFANFQTTCFRLRILVEAVRSWLFQIFVWYDWSLCFSLQHCIFERNCLK